MTIIEKLDRNKKQILPELYEWAETFEWEEDEEGEKTKVPYDIVFDLVQRFENGQCNKDDYDNILFHIDQINYNEEKIVL